MEEECLLKLENLCVYNRGVKIVNIPNLEIHRNEIFGILGHNGAGKTSLAYSILGLNGYTTTGRILYKGKDISGMGVSERAKLGIALTWQEPARFEGLTVKEYLELGMKADANENYCRDCLTMFGLNPEMYLYRRIDEKLSGGERKRIELASAFAMKPELLILDEPDSGMDLHGILNLKKVLKDKYSHNMGIIIITHQEEIADLSDRIAIICRGSIEKTGDRKDMLNYFKERCETCGGKIFL